MIDFRYHLVSLVSVFLALAVGIVLGAGPLRESIGTRLTEEVQSLRSGRDALRTQLATQEAAVADRNDFITEAAPALIGQQLDGQSVVVVRLAGVEDAAVEPLLESLATAGATVTARVQIGAEWVTADKQAARDELVARLRTSVPADAASGQAGEQLASLLARSLVSGAPAGPSPPDAVATGILSAFTAADLVQVDGDVEGLADAALLVVPAVLDPNGDQVATPTPSEAIRTAYVQVATALDAGGSGAVVIGPASSATGTGLVATVRGDDAAARAVSTVDTGETPMGAVTSVLALDEQLAGGAGHYGFGDGASSAMPKTANAAAVS